MSPKQHFQYGTIIQEQTNFTEVPLTAVFIIISKSNIYTASLVLTISLLSFFFFFCILCFYEDSFHQGIYPDTNLFLN